MQLAHTAICVPDVDAAAAWYESVLGLTVLSPPYLMEGDSITDDMGELLPTRPVAVKAAIIGNAAGDHVIELIGYPNEPAGDGDAPRAIAQTGISHVGIVCDDIDDARARIEDAGGTFIVSGVANVARLRTTWFRDPWGVLFILMQKHDPSHAYWRQY